MEWDRKRSRLLISSAVRSRSGGREGRIQALRVPVAERPSLVDLCVHRRPADIGPLVPIGLSLREDEEQTLLYLVAKAVGRPGRGAIEKYRVEEDVLTFLHRFETPLLTVPNDLLALEGDELYVSNASSSAHGRGALEVALKEARSSVVHRRRGAPCAPEDGCWETAAGGIAFPNGIALQRGGSPEEDRLRVAAFNAKRILSFQRDRETGRLTRRADEDAPLPAHPDNLMLDDEGRLLVAAHPSRPKTFLHLLRLRSTTPSVVFRVGPGKEVTELFVDSGKKIAGSSTAVAVDGRLYISQVRQGFVGVCRLPATASAGKDLDVPVRPVHADPLPVPDQASGVLHPHHGR
jgi:hypothetical protein